VAMDIMGRTSESIYNRYRIVDDGEKRDGVRRMQEYLAALIGCDGGGAETGDCTHHGAVKITQTKTTKTRTKPRGPLIRAALFQPTVRL